MQRDSLIGSDDAAKILRVHRATFLRWLAAGLITPVTQLPGPNGAYLFERADVERLAAEQTDERVS
jgi:predicted site-specific integrase-resolvase